MLTFITLRIGFLYYIKIHDRFIILKIQVQNYVFILYYKIK